MTAHQALFGFVGVTLALVGGTFLYRSIRFLRGAKINEWPRGEKNPNDAPIAKRLSDAHANCIENLVIFAVLVLGASALGKSAAIDPLAKYVLYARIGQSTTHLLGTGPRHVTVRATFWFIQLGLFVYLLFKLAV